MMYRVLLFLLILSFVYFTFGCVGIPGCPFDTCCSSEEAKCCPTGPENPCTSPCGCICANYVCPQNSTFPNQYSYSTSGPVSTLDYCYFNPNDCSAPYCVCKPGIMPYPKPSNPAMVNGQYLIQGTHPHGTVSGYCK